MYLTTIDPFTREFDRIVRRAFAPAGLGTASSGPAAFAQALPMDTLRRDGEVVLRFDVPGVNPEKIDVTVDHGVLSVSATREETKAEGDEQIVRERYFGSFTRRVRLSDNLDADAIEASHADGVLELRIPVREAAKPRKIEVNANKELAA
ncbi:MAG TPA: Hsp20/alpha crystallin family protein [Trebonia sp.]